MLLHESSLRFFTLLSSGEGGSLSSGSSSSISSSLESSLSSLESINRTPPFPPGSTLSTNAFRPGSLVLRSNLSNTFPSSSVSKFSSSSSSPSSSSSSKSRFSSNTPRPRFYINNRGREGVP